MRVSGEESIEPRAWAAREVRAFARATNVLIASRTFSVRGDPPRAAALRELLSAIGARESDSPDWEFDVDAEPRWLITGDRRRSTTRRIVWAQRYMPVTRAFGDHLQREKLVKGKRIGISMVLEPKTAVLALALKGAGAIVSVFAHPDETDDAVAEYLRGKRIPVFAKSGASADEHRGLVEGFLDAGLDFLMDDGSHVIRYAHEHRPDVFETLIGAAEETTSGLTPLRIMDGQGALRIPVIAVNDARSKTLFDNRYGTGQSCVFAILDLVPMDLVGKTVVVVGFGNVGVGVAHHARALGATVVVVETDAVRALQASFEGYAVSGLIAAAAISDILISATGVKNTITVDALRAAKPDAIVAVAGGVDQEIALDAAVAAGGVMAAAGDRIETLTFPGAARTRILAEGGCINVTAAEGNPIEIMDLSFAVQLQALRQFFESDPPPAGVHPLRDDLDRAVAAAALGRESELGLAATNIVDQDWNTARFGSHPNAR